MKTVTRLKMKFAIGVGVAMLVAAGAATIAVSQNTPTASPPAQSSEPEVLINSAFVIAPNEQVGSIVRELSNPVPPVDPASKAFAAMVNKFPGAKIISSPRMTTALRRQAVLSMTQPQTVNGTNVETGPTLDIYAEKDTNGKMVLTIVATLCELTDTTPPELRNTRIDELTLPFSSGDTVLVRNQIGSAGKNVPPTAGSPAESLLLFVNAAFIDSHGNAAAAPATN